MPRNFQDLSPEAQANLSGRYGRYGISGEEGYNNHLSDEAKELSSDELIELMEQKDISHIQPQSTHPEHAGDVNNTYLEDSSVNRARGAREVSEEEIETALKDQNKDVDAIQAEDGTWDDIGDKLEQFDEDLIEEVLGGSLIAGTVLSGIQTKQAIERGDIVMRDAPRFFAFKTGGRTIRYAIIGFSLTSSSPVIVSAGVGYILFKNQRLIKSIYSKANKVLKSEMAQYAISMSKKSVKYVGEKGYQVITSETSKQIAKTTSKTASKGSKVAVDLFMTGLSGFSDMTVDAGRLAKLLWKEKNEKAIK